MNFTVIMWVAVAVSVAAAVLVILKNSARARKAQAENAKLLIGKVASDYPDIAAAVAAITVTDKALSVTAKESGGLESRTYDFEQLGISVSGEDEMSQLTNYFLDAFSDCEWTKTMERGTAEGSEPAPVTGFTLTNRTRVMSEHFKVAPRL